MAKVLRQITVQRDISFDNLKEEVEEFAKKWSIDVSDVNIEAEDYTEWGDTFCRLNIYGHSEPSAEEFEEMEKRVEEARARARARKLEQLEQLKKELGIE